VKSFLTCSIQQLRHENLVNLIEVFRKKKRLYLVFEFMDHTILDELERCPSGLEESLIRKVIWQVLRGIEFCHLHNVSDMHNGGFGSASCFGPSDPDLIPKLYISLCFLPCQIVTLSKGSPPIEHQFYRINHGSFWKHTVGLVTPSIRNKMI